ncbi:MAG: NAD(P)-dependent alcohol dehydrogenase [Egibacteraceae bacterium]
MKITAAVVESPGMPFELQELTLDEPRHDEVLVRVVASGMCHTDISVRDGATPFPLPAVLGHEGAGVVEAVGATVSTLAPGDHVVLSFDSCGRCASCMTARPVYCRHWLPLNLLGGSRLDGSSTLSRSDGSVHGHFFGQSSMATYALASERSAVKVPSDLPLDLLGPLACGVQTGAGSVLNVLSPAAGSTLAVFGAGGVGLSAIMAAQLTPLTRLVAIDVDDHRLALAREFGATDAVNATLDDPVDAIRQLTDGAGADCTIETSGRLPVLRQAVDALGVTGMCVVIGAPPLGSEVALDVPDLLSRGIRVVGTNQGDSNPKRFIPQLIELHRRGRLPFDRLLRFFPLARVNDAVASALSGETVKPVLLMPTP